MTRLRTLDFTALAVLAVVFSACATTQTPAPVAGARVGDKPVDPGLYSAGKQVFERNGCYTCHAFGRVLGGPDLVGITEGRDHDWLRKWLKDTDVMIDGDPLGQALLKQWRGVRMPNFRLGDRDIDALLHYMAQESARARAAAGE
jgi:mono/diheme cytochrome c family protein